MRQREATWAPEREPVKLQSPSKVVFGHLYAGAGDGVVLEVVCRAKGCRRAGMRAVHLFDVGRGCRTEFQPGGY